MKSQSTINEIRNVCIARAVRRLSERGINSVHAFAIEGIAHHSVIEHLGRGTPVLPLVPLWKNCRNIEPATRRHYLRMMMKSNLKTEVSR